MLAGLACMASFLPVAAQTGGGTALFVESVGGSIGSGAGLGLGLVLAQANDCTTDDIACYIESAGIAVAISTAGAALGAHLAGRIADTRPSGIGSILGAVSGAVAGIGVSHLLSDELDLTHSEIALAFSYAISQGFVAALGSRLGAWLRG